MDADRMLRRKQVEYIVGLSRSSIYDMVATGRFPKPIPIGKRAVAWPESQVRAWLTASLIERERICAASRQNI